MTPPQRMSSSETNESSCPMPKRHYRQVNNIIATSLPSQVISIPSKYTSRTGDTNCHLIVKLPPRQIVIKGTEKSPFFRRQPPQSNRTSTSKACNARESVINCNCKGTVCFFSSSHNKSIQHQVTRLPSKLATPLVLLQPRCTATNRSLGTP
uniref:Uncharacterized protein n=1 Tax=Oryza punctata TaxID=4537 RepID=A0A0E0KFI6_ORYPU